MQDLVKKILHDTADNHLLPTLSLLNSGSLRMGVKFFSFAVDFVFKEDYTTPSCLLSDLKHLWKNLHVFWET